MSQGRLSQRLVGGLGGILALMMMVPVLLWLTATDPIAAAKVAAGAFTAQFVGSKVSDGPFGGHAKVRLRTAGEAGKPIEIALSRPFWSRGWRSISPGE